MVHRVIAQPITSCKLPKHSYFPELEKEIGVLAKRLSTQDSPIITVDHVSDFDFKTDAISDKVHPNADGAEKMVQIWFAAGSW